ncbi:BTAD domain-containing putative transcriptional regulator [Amycolatopsis sp. NPDC021455]|uniref:AfsR/SARP family transcriptional regulator n=1 Tax=Amycolatopsis sp. NPDC021455 TaxID=3154901 RepID=UPI0033E9F04C
MSIRVLGNLEVSDDGRDLTPTAPKPRQILAFLALRHNQPVRIGELTEELWGEGAPPSALPTVQTYIYKLRKVFPEEGGPIGAIRSTKPQGYRLAVRPEDIDLCRFEALAAQGRARLGAGELPAATRILGQALALWRGPLLGDVTTGDLLSAQVTRLEELRRQVLDWRIEADLALGRHAEVVGELKMLSASHPLEESVHAQLILALHRCRRRFEALDVYRRFRAGLAAEGAGQPSPRLRALHDAVLASDPRLDSPAPAPVQVSAQAAASEPRVPRQLPADLPDFSCRSSALKAVERQLVEPREASTAVRIVTVTGVPGVGKSVLAVRAAHRVAAHFPDGQFHARLTGRADAGDVPTRFLLAAGFAADEIPASLDEQSTLFRTWCASRRVLVVLDDATTPEQIRPLLPASPQCGVIVTSRIPLLPDSEVVRLRSLDVGEGVVLLAKLVGHSRISQDPAAAESIVRACGGLPKALRAFGRRLSDVPAGGFRELSSKIVDGGRLLDELSHGDFDVRAAYGSSYGGLTPAERGAFRLLSLLPGGEFGAAEAGDLLGRPSADAEKLLEKLADLQLVHVVRCGEDGTLYYSFHELARVYARELLDRLLVGGDEPAGRALVAHRRG